MSPLRKLLFACRAGRSPSLSFRQRRCSSPSRLHHSALFQMGATNWKKQPGNVAVGQPTHILTAGSLTARSSFRVFFIFRPFLVLVLSFVSRRYPETVTHNPPWLNTTRLANPAQGCRPWGDSSRCWGRTSRPSWNNARHEQQFLVTVLFICVDYFITSSLTYSNLVCV